MKFKVGDIITDDLIHGRVLGEGSIKFGKKDLPGYRVEILAGHQKGQETVIVEEDEVRKSCEI